ncbi:hypothetical protein B0T17DRAFT_544258 [Bombardia bombarda]|uniref:Uncharacterized protein n=1 Tax=Bombardia bombarda TaxID=252184 RepID=A0AA39WBN2_9PEZI|nr:hypothetical protein B0T17DRAFT_544258 [Bombardia bombarda]
MYLLFDHRIPHPVWTSVDRCTPVSNHGLFTFLKASKHPLSFCSAFPGSQLQSFSLTHPPLPAFP